MKAPAFQFYAAEYLADEHVQLMTLEEEGAYIRLLSFCWREGSIPNDPSALSRLCKGASTTVLTTVLKRFKPNGNQDDRLIHPRLESERVKQQQWREKSAQGGRASAHKRKKLKSEPPRQGGATTLQPDRLNQRATLQSSSSSASSSNEKIERHAKPRDARIDHPALIAIREIKGRFPSKDVWDLVITAAGECPDVPRMRECWLAWRAKNFGPENLGWLVDWYVNGIPGGSSNGHKPTASERRVDQLKANAEFLRSAGGAADSQEPDRRRIASTG